MSNKALIAVMGWAAAFALAGATYNTNKKLNTSLAREAALRAEIKRLVPCDKAVKESRALYKAQLALRNASHLTVAQNTKGYKTNDP